MEIIPSGDSSERNPIKDDFMLLCVLSFLSLRCFELKYLEVQRCRSCPRPPKCQVASVAPWTKFTLIFNFVLNVLTHFPESLGWAPWVQTRKNDNLRCPAQRLVWMQNTRAIREREQYITAHRAVHQSRSRRNPQAAYFQLHINFLFSPSSSSSSSSFIVLGHSASFLLQL